MRYLFHFFFLFSIISFATFLSGYSSSKNTDNATYSSEKEKQAGYSEDPNYLFESIQAHKFFSANFEQKTFNGEQTRVIEGKIIADRSGIFKISYFEPLNEIIFSDGKNFYRYDSVLEQLNIQPLELLLSETPVGLFTLNLEEIKKLFSVSECWKKFNKYTCLLTSKNNESFVQWVYIGLKNRVFSSMEYLDSFDQKVNLNFKNISIEAIPAEEFKLNIPKGTDIVGFESRIK